MTMLHTKPESVISNLDKDNDLSFRSLANAFPLLVWSANADGELDFCNCHFERYTGLTLEETLRQGWGGISTSRRLSTMSRRTNAIPSDW